MSTLDDKILGEKSHYYCSSSEEEDNTNDDNKESTEANDTINSNMIREENKDKHWQRWDGYSTGPKGVIKDWQRYKQFENEKRDDKQRDTNELIKKLSISCRSHLDEESDKNDNQNSDEDSDLLNDHFLKEYMIKRMQEMVEQIDSVTKDRPNFGELIYLSNGTEFLKAIDSELKFVTIICHIFTKDNHECQDMNGCLSYLAQHYPKIKFCAIESSVAGMTKHFSKNGVPALLVYKSGILLANFVRLSDEFTKPFFAVDIEKFLIDHGIIQNSAQNTNIERSIRESAIDSEDLSD